MGAKPARCLFDALPFARAGRASLSVIFKRREGVTLLVDRLRMRSSMSGKAVETTSHSAAPPQVGSARSE
jgi:hypothetical protein